MKVFYRQKRGKCIKLKKIRQNIWIYQEFILLLQCIHEKIQRLVFLVVNLVLVSMLGGLS